LAQHIFNLAKELIPDSSVINNELGFLKMDQGRFSEARNYFKMAIRQDPNYLEAKLSLHFRIIGLSRDISGTGYGEVVYFAHQDDQGLGIVEDYGDVFHAVFVEIGASDGARVSAYGIVIVREVEGAVAPSF